jgi:hypothetical protein
VRSFRSGRSVSGFGLDPGVISLGSDAFGMTTLGVLAPDAGFAAVMASN